MSAPIPPRYELPIADSKGRISREWYKYLVGLGLSVGSDTFSDDAQLSDNSDASAAESLGLTALKAAKDAQGLFLLTLQDDKKTVDDTSLLAWWPSDSK